MDEPPPDERFTSLIDMQDFKRRLRDNSRSQVISSRGLTVRPVEDDTRALQIMGYGNGLPAAAPTHWSFGQLCSLASPGNSPASYFRETQMPAPMIADCLNYNLRFTRGVEDIGVLLTTNERCAGMTPNHRSPGPSRRVQHVVILFRFGRGRLRRSDAQNAA